MYIYAYIYLKKNDLNKQYLFIHLVKSQKVNSTSKR